MQEPRQDTRREIRGRPHERTMERVALATWAFEFSRENQVSPSTLVWFERRFLDELDRRRGLERRWREVFWLARYVILSGSLVLPVLITAGKSVTWLNFAAIVVSILVALATAMEALLRSGRKWRLYRQGADRMPARARRSSRCWAFTRSPIRTKGSAYLKRTSRPSSTTCTSPMSPT